MRSIVQITNGVTGIVDKVQTLLVYWEKKYKHMWDQDKDAYIRCAMQSKHGTCLLNYGHANSFTTGASLALHAAVYVVFSCMSACRRYEKAQKPLTAFDADITKYADLSEEVLAENAAESIKFLFVDCGPLKQVNAFIVSLCMHTCHCLDAFSRYLPVMQQGGVNVARLSHNVVRWYGLTYPHRLCCYALMWPVMCICAFCSKTSGSATPHLTILPLFCRLWWVIVRHGVPTSPAC